MAYPYSHNGRANHSEVLVFKGQEAMNTTSAQTHTFDINIPYGAYAIGFNVWTTGADQSTKVWMSAYVDHDQTVETGKINLVRYDNTTAASSVTIAATTGVDGEAGVVALGSLGSVNVALSCSHGYKLSVEANTNSGTVDYEIVASKNT